MSHQAMYCHLEYLRLFIYIKGKNEKKRKVWKYNNIHPHLEETLCTSFMIVFIYFTISQELPPSFSFNCSKWMNPTNVNILLSFFSVAIYIQMRHKNDHSTKATIQANYFFFSHQFSLDFWWIRVSLCIFCCRKKGGGFDGIFIRQFRATTSSQ